MARTLYLAAAGPESGESAIAPGLAAAYLVAAYLVAAERFVHGESLAPGRVLG